MSFSEYRGLYGDLKLRFSTASYEETATGSFDSEAENIKFVAIKILCCKKTISGLP